jgi:hypothetical protein
MTRGRLILFIAVPAAILLVYGFVVNSTWKETKVPTPLQGEAAINPFYAAVKLVKELGAEGRWSRDHAQLPKPTEALLVSGWHWNVSEPRRVRLQKWVESGGRLVVDGSTVGIEDLASWLDLQIVYPFEDDSEEDYEDEPAPTADSLDDCREFTHQVTPPGVQHLSNEWTFCSFDRERRFVGESNVTWALADSYGTQVIRVTRGRGSVTIVDGTPFMWRELQRSDHGLLLVNALQLRRGDSIWFLSGDREESLLDLIWRHGWPVVVLGLIAVLTLLWRRGARLGPLLPDPDPARRSLGEQILGTGRFIFRAGGAHALHTAAMQALDRVAEQKLRGYARMAEPERITVLAESTAIEAARLTTARDWPRAAKPHDLATAVACLESARRILAALKIR